MIFRSGKWLATCAVLIAFTESMAHAAITRSIPDWAATGENKGPVSLGDKLYTLLATTGDWGETDVRFVESFSGRVHSIQFLDPPGGDLTLEYTVEVISGPERIRSIGLSADLTGENSFSITKTVFDTDNKLLGTLSVSDTNLSTNPLVFGSYQSKLRVVETIFQNGDQESILSFSNTITQEVVPEPSIWLLSAFAAGGLALVRYRKTNRSPADAPPA